MQTHPLTLVQAAAAALLVTALAHAGVHPEEAAQLGTTLTPLGAEKAGNKEGTIPEWTGGLATPPAGWKSGAKNADPLAADKPLFSISAKNLAQYQDKLSDGQAALLKKYPDSYRLDIYPTHRTAAAPAWMYERTKANALSGTLVEGSLNPYPAKVAGGIPFPIPKSGIEVVWNHLLHATPEAFRQRMTGWMVNADGKAVMVQDSLNEIQSPYHRKGGTPETWDGITKQISQTQFGPAIRAGEAIIGLTHADETKSATWVYLTGQRRVRKLPQAAGDTPAPMTSGMMNFDDIQVFFTSPGQYDWKLVGKKELFIPYNGNRFTLPATEAEMLGKNHINPDHVRWELHRVWVVDATLKAGQRNTAKRGRYYFDEDSWIAVLGDRWDANNQLWKSNWSVPMVYPEYPVVDAYAFGFYDLISGAYMFSGLMNTKDAVNLERIEPKPASFFTPDAMVARQLR